MLDRLRPLAHLLLLSLTAVPAWGMTQETGGEVTAQDETPVLRYVRVRDGGATARNIYDVQGVPLMELETSQLLAVYAERGGWLSVEAPGGFPVWVFGRFLKPTDRPAVFEVTTNNVYLRPNPDSSAASFPLDRRLQAGDLVTACAVPADPTALGSTWVQIWTPPGVGAWVQAARTQSLASGEDGAELWRQAEAALVELVANVEARATEAAAGTDATTRQATVRDAASPEVGRASEALAGARALLDLERDRPLPDFAAVEQALRGVLELSPDAVTRAATLDELEKLELLKDKRRLEAELARERDRERSELLEQQQERWDEQAEADARFEGRGVVELYRAASGRTALRLNRGGNVVAELACAEGRYELGLFEGAEVQLVGQVDGTATLHTGVPRVDVAALQVLALRRR